MSATSGPDNDSPSRATQSVQSADEEEDPQTEQQNTASTSGRSDSEAAALQAKTACAFYMRTGTCAYGERCKFLHPEDRPTVFNNTRGLPLRPSEPECTFYIRNGWCAFAETCKFHHPELPPGTTFPPQQQASGSPNSSRSPAGPHQQQQQQQYSGRQHHRNGSTGRQQHYQHSYAGAGGGGGSQHRAVFSSPQTHHAYPHGPPFAYYMTPYAGHMPGSPGQGLLMHYGFYPTMAPDAGSRGGMFPVVTSAMIHPVMHMRGYEGGQLSVSAAGVSGGQRGSGNTLHRSNSSGSGQYAGERGPGRAGGVRPHSQQDRPTGPGRSAAGAGSSSSFAGGGPGGFNNSSSSSSAGSKAGPSKAGGGSGGAGDAAAAGCSRTKSPPLGSSSGDFGPLGPSAEARAAAAAAVAAATAAPMPRPSSASSSRPEPQPQSSQEGAGQQQDDADK